MKSIFYCLLGMILAFTSGNIIWKEFQAHEWKTTTGVITTVESRKKKDSILHDQHHELPTVHYNYDVEGNCLTGSRVTLEPDEIDHLVGLFGMGNPEDSYRVSEPVIVYYNPNGPSEAVLRTRSHPIVYTIFGAGAISMFFGLIGIQSRHDTP